jgi:hypothetical protein
MTKTERGPMKKRATRRRAERPESTEEATAVERELQRFFSPQVIAELREVTGYNPRQRIVTGFRLILTVVEAFLVGQTLNFSALRAIFVRRFGFVRPCPFQMRFKQASAAAFFRAALERLVTSVVEVSGLRLQGPLGKFADVRLYDGTGQRVPPRGHRALPACTKGRAGAKWVAGYSLKTGLLEEAICAPETASETPLWRKLVPSFTRRVLYVFDLGFFERRLFAEAHEQGAHVLMRLKKTAKVRIVGQVRDGAVLPVDRWSLGYFLSCTRTRRTGTLFDLDVLWGKGNETIRLRLVGYAHSSKQIRWYLTTVPRYLLSPQQVIETYRLRWLVEFLFRELKQNADLGRSFTADPHAVEALTYGAMLAHALVRSLRIHAALKSDVPIEQLRPLACLHVARAFARDIVDALAAPCRVAFSGLVEHLTPVLLDLAREAKTSRSRSRISLKLGAVGA